MEWHDILKQRGLYCTKHRKGNIDAWYECKGCERDFAKEYPNIKHGFGMRDSISEEEYDPNNPEHFKRWEPYFDEFGWKPQYYKGDSARYLRAREDFFAKNPRRWVDRG